MSFPAELKQHNATLDPASSAALGGWQACSKRQGKYNDQQQGLEQGLGKHAHDQSTLELGCALLFLLIPINTAALGEGSDGFVMDNTAGDGKRALVLSMSNLTSCVRGHCARPGLLCSLQQVTLQDSTAL